MSVTKFLRAAATAGLAVGVALAFASTADAQKRIKWKMQSAFGSKLPHIGTSGVRFSKNVLRLSQGKLLLKFFEPGALVPALECFDSVSKGAIESCWTTPGYHTGKYPALAFFTTVPFGPQIGEFMAWKWFGGGNDLRDEIYVKHDLIAFDSFAIGPETSGWFKQPITSLDQLKGLKMRFFGLGAKVMSKLGVSTQLLAGADIYPALERGVIDATEFSMPSIDYDLGFYQIAKYNYFPGWHQQASIGELLMNAEKFNGLKNQQRAWLKAACNDNVLWTYVRSEAVQFKAMQKLKAKGVIFKRWPDETLAVFKAKWEEVVVEESAKDPLFAEVHKSYKSFREQYKIWMDNGYLRKN